jgi:hypothetical protein
MAGASGSTLCRISAVHEKMAPLAEKIQNATVYSIAGLRSKALVALWDSMPVRADDHGCLEIQAEEPIESLFYAVAGQSPACLRPCEGLKKSWQQQLPDPFTLRTKR